MEALVRGYQDYCTSRVIDSIWAKDLPGTPHCGGTDLYFQNSVSRAQLCLGLFNRFAGPRSIPNFLTIVLREHTLKFPLSCGLLRSPQARRIRTLLDGVFR